MADLRPTTPYRVAWHDRRLAADTGVFPSDDFLLADTASGSVTLTMPRVAGCRGTWFMAKKLTAANTLTVAAAAGETIDGAASVALTAQYASVRLYSDGATWWTF